MGRDQVNQVSFYNVCSNISFILIQAGPDTTLRKSESKKNVDLLFILLHHYKFRLVFCKIILMHKLFRGSKKVEKHCVNIYFLMSLAEVCFFFIKLRNVDILHATKI